mmetsp:Transcript_16982/g.50106  ORF Transcript_16982/g.50106 Transcript_16982/m.50106 type:complete len:430 (+) Transcript_16982:272-1561(+)
MTAELCSTLRGLNIEMNDVTLYRSLDEALAAFERIRVARDYPTPRSARDTYKVLGFFYPAMLAPLYIADNDGSDEPWAPYYVAALVALVFGLLVSVQDKLDNPFNSYVVPGDEGGPLQLVSRHPDNIDLSRLVFWPMLAISGTMPFGADVDEGEACPACTLRGGPTEEVQELLRRRSSLGRHFLAFNMPSALPSRTRSYSDDKVAGCAGLTRSHSTKSVNRRHILDAHFYQPLKKGGDEPQPTAGTNGDGRDCTAGQQLRRPARDRRSLSCGDNPATQPKRRARNTALAPVVADAADGDVVSDAESVESAFYPDEADASTVSTAASVDPSPQLGVGEPTPNHIAGRAVGVTTAEDPNYDAAFGNGDKTPPTSRFTVTPVPSVAPPSAAHNTTRHGRNGSKPNHIRHSVAGRAKFGPMPLNGAPTASIDI